MTIVNDEQLYHIVAKTLAGYIASGVPAKNIAADCGLSVSTIRKFAYQTTIYPRMHTVYVILAYFGYTLTLQQKGRKQ